MYHDKKPIKSDGGSTSYYELPEFATELQHLIEHKRMGFAQGNIFKAAYRLGEKDGVSIRYDLNKIIRFANFMLQELDRDEFAAEQMAEDQAAAKWFADEQAKAETEHEGCIPECKSEPCMCHPAIPVVVGLGVPLPHEPVAIPGSKTYANPHVLKELAEEGDKIRIYMPENGIGTWHTVRSTGSTMANGFQYTVDHVEGKSNILIVPHHHVFDIDRKF